MSSQVCVDTLILYGCSECVKTLHRESNNCSAPRIHLDVGIASRTTETRHLPVTHHNVYKICRIRQCELTILLH